MGEEEKEEDTYDTDTRYTIHGEREKTEKYTADIRFCYLLVADSFFFFFFGNYDTYNYRVSYHMYFYFFLRNRYDFYDNSFLSIAMNL